MKTETKGTPVDYVFSEQEISEMVRLSALIEKEALEEWLASDEYVSWING